MSDSLPQDAASFIRAIHPHADPSWFLHARCISASKQELANTCIPFESVDALNSFASDHDGAGHVFVNLALTTAPLSACPKIPDLDVWDCLFVDIDLATAKFPDRPKTTEEAIAFIQALPITPTAIINTGSGGLGVFYALNAPVILKTDGDLQHRNFIASGFADYINWQAALQFGWQGFDGVSDQTRVHRAPYTTNVKPDVVAECVPLVVSETTHDLAMIADLIASVPPASNDNKAPKSLRPVSSLEKQLEEIDREWFEEALENKGRKRKGEPLEANPAAIYAGCAFIRHAHENSHTLSEPEWHAMISILAHAKDGDKVIHEMSRNYPGYDAKETDRKIWEARRSPKPFGCGAISKLYKGCKACPFAGADFNPIELGNRTKDQVELLADHIYVQQTQSIVDVAHDDRLGVSPKQFAEYYAHKRLLGSPEKVFLNDPLCRKVKERVYAPDLPYGLATIEEKVVFNTYRAPVHTNGCPEAAKKFVDHLDYLIPDNVERDYLLKYLAHLVQKPWIKIASAITIVGAQGTGKSMVLNLMREVLGASNVNVSKGASLKSNFNGQLSGHVLLGLEEVSIEGRAETYDMIKALITNPFDEFEQKFRNKEWLPTPRGIILLTNDKYGLYLPDRDERRFSVLTATSQKRSPDYYKALFDFTPKYVAGVYDLLMKTDLSGFNPHAEPLSTAAKDKMALNSKSEVELIVRDLFDEGAHPFDHDIQKFTDLAHAINERLPLKSGAKPIQRALEANGCVPDGRQCRLRNGERVRFWFIRSADKYASLSPAELARAYEQQGKPPSLQIAN